MHVHDFGAALFDGFVGDTDDSTVVAVDVGRRLWMALLGEDDSHWYGVLAVVEHATGFGCGGDDDFWDGAVGMNCAIFGWWFVGSKGLSHRVSWWVAQEEMAALAAARVALGQVGWI